MKMKKMLALLLALVLCLGLCACGGGGGTVAADNPFVGKWNYYDGLFSSYEFKADGTVIFTDSDGSQQTGSYTADGSSGTIKNDEASADMTVEGDVLSMADLTLFRAGSTDENVFIGEWYYDGGGVPCLLTMYKDCTLDFRSISDDEIYDEGIYLVGGGVATMGDGRVIEPADGGVLVDGYDIWVDYSGGAPVPDDSSDPVYIDTSSIAGEWYNDAVQMTLNIGSDGSFALSDGSDTASGSVEFDGTNVTLSANGDIMAGVLDSDGDISFDGIDGYFVSSGYMEPQMGDPGDNGDNVSADYTYTDNGDGTTTVRDYVHGVKFTYASSWMTVWEDYLSDAAMLTDDQGGYFTARDVTDDYLAYEYSDEEYIADYIAGYASSDYCTLYDADAPEVLELLQEHVDKESRIAIASANLYTEGSDVQIHCFVFRSTFNDGEVRYIADTYFAPFGNDTQMNDLRSNIKDIGAIRRG